MIKIAVIVWWLIGSSGVYYFWTNDPIMKGGSIIIKYMFVIIAGIMGPFSWPAGYYIHRVM